jgi:hypothetical protein
MLPSFFDGYRFVTSITMGLAIVCLIAKGLGSYHRFYLFIFERAVWSRPLEKTRLDMSP